MRKANGKIGFNDGLLMAIGIPLLAFIVPIVFMNCRFTRPPFFTIDKYLSTLCITTVIWVGNRFIMIYSRMRYPLFNEVRRRIIFQSVLMVIFTLISNIILGKLFDKVFRADGPISLTDIIIHSNSAALFCTIMVIAVYESIYFMNQLRQAVQESEKLKRETISAELSALKTQVNPHFLFNNLNTLASLIPEDPKVAVDFVQQLSKLYRHILEVKDEPVIALREELDVMQAYAFLLQTRFGNNLDVAINVPEEKLDKKIVPLSLQILMENAIKHNVVSVDRPLRIEVIAQNGKLVVSNNLQKKNQISESTGIGLENIRNRYRLFGNGQVEVSDSGSSFTVSIPLLDK
jgi:two-component system, LytTR family, sensor kinase